MHADFRHRPVFLQLVYMWAYVLLQADLCNDCYCCCPGIMHVHRNDTDDKFHYHLKCLLQFDFSPFMSWIGGTQSMSEIEHLTAFWEVTFFRSMIVF